VEKRRAEKQRWIRLGNNRSVERTDDEEKKGTKNVPE
jgi:hypothetical protein